MSALSSGIDLSGEFAHEEVVLFTDRATGLVGCLAIHSTVLGPAAGGLRLSTYDDVSAAASDALRLSQAMTCKNAAAGLDLGGGKAVLVDDGRWSDPATRTARLHAFAERLDRLDGRYVTAEDVGTTPQDMQTIAEVTSHVAGLPTGAGDPSAATARTVFAAIADAAELERGTDLHRATVGVLGTGHVGARLAAMLRAAGAEVLVADIDERRAAAVADEHGARVAPVLGFTARPMDVFAPCALGGVLGEAEVSHLRAGIVAGAANNPLRAPHLADALHARGILYVPDFLANCGGIIQVASEVLRFDAAETDRRIDAATRRTRAVIADARTTDRSPVSLALDLVRERLEQAATADMAGAR